MVEGDRHLSEPSAPWDCHTPLRSWGMAWDADITLKFKLLLIADHIAEADAAGDEVEADRLLLSPRFDEHDITRHLARQMRLRDHLPHESDLHGNAPVHRRGT